MPVILVLLGSVAGCCVILWSLVWSIVAVWWSSGYGLCFELWTALSPVAVLALSPAVVLVVLVAMVVVVVVVPEVPVVVVSVIFPFYVVLLLLQVAVVRGRLVWGRASHHPSDHHRHQVYEELGENHHSSVDVVVVCLLPSVGRDV